MRRLLLGALCGVVALGCGGGDDGKGSGSLAGAPLDCAWLDGNNCWKTTVAAATSCVPDTSTRGTLSADGKTCTYASGTTIDFATPVVLPLDPENQPDWNFTVTTGGQQCMSYESTESSGLTLTVEGMSVSEKDQGFGLQITCPDGSQYAASNGLDLFSCLLQDGPGTIDSWSDTSVTLGLLDGSSTPPQVFDCERAP